MWSGTGWSNPAGSRCDSVRNDRILEISEDEGDGFGRHSMRHVAERAGVSVSSVSRVLSEHPDVSDGMRRRVMATVEELGYAPDILAQSLRSGATQSVGFVVGDISNPLLAEIVLGAEMRLQASKYSLLVTNSQNSPALDAAHALLFRQRRVDGLLLSLADEDYEPTVSELERSKLPFVLVERELKSFPDSSAVLSDHARGISDAVEHLAGLGHRRIALIGGLPSVRPTRARAAALEAACRRVGATPMIKDGSFTAEHGERSAIEFFDMVDGPSALICGGNQVLIGVLRAVRKRELTVPDDVSLVTCDEVSLAEFVMPRLATIGRDISTLGRTSAEELLRQLQGEEPRTVTLPTAFVPSASCGPPPA